MTTTRNGIPTLTATGRQVNGCEFGSDVLPEYAGGTLGYERIARLPDGRAVYAIDDEAGGMTGLYLEAEGVDAGGNVRRVAVAADGDGHAGLTAPVIPRTGVKLTLVGGKRVGWLRR